MEERLRVVEWEPVPLTTEQSADVRDGLERLRSELRPTLDLGVIVHDQLTVQNLIGSARMPSGRVLEAEPKIANSGNWASALVQLLDKDTRIAVTGSQGSRSSARQDLTRAIAFEYARRLESAIRRDGPLHIYEHNDLVSRRPHGHLNISRWVRTSVLNPTLFPVGRDEYTISNDFSRGLSRVSGLLSRSGASGQLASRLRELETAVIAGNSLPSYVNPAVALRRLPAQWLSYQPAWDIAAAILRNRSVVGDPGRASGLEVAVEPWPLLETLLERSLQTFASNARAEGYRFERKSIWPLIAHPNGRPAQQVEPDGLLSRDGKIVATFEAKYSRPGSVPAREHTFQALTTASALNSPLAVLVYPGDQPVRFFEVRGGNPTPAKLATVGLSMFAYSRGAGDEMRAEVIKRALSGSASEIEVLDGVKKV